MLFQWISRHFKLRTTTTVATKVIFGAVVFSFLLFFSTSVHAQQLTATDLGLNNQVQTNLGLPATDIRLVVANIIRVAFGLLGIVFLILVLYAGFLWMTAGGNDEQIGSAKKMLTNGVVGLIIMLSAYGIVSFVISKLLSAGGGSGTGGSNQGTTITQENFFGSGGLGTVIKDHFPGRDQTGVPRNTKIIITFSSPVLASSFIDNTNGSKNADGSPILGDCINQGKNMNWDTDCDKLKPGNDLITITRSDTNVVVAGAAALTSGSNNQIDTVVIRPIDALGSKDVAVSYNVRIGKDVLFDDTTNGNPSIFAGRQPGRDFYDWIFTCSTVLDTTPPHVLDVFPKDNTTEDKNSVIQINFSKPMDPTGLQGNFTDKSGYFSIPGNTIFLKTNNSAIPEGSFRLINNYQTLEYTPSKPCGVNACGGTVYCLPVCDAPGANCAKDKVGNSLDDYSFLVRAGVVFNVNSPEAVPFSGAMDLSGNALDGNNDGHVKLATQTGPYFPDQQQFDNYFWNFTLSNQLDVSAPFIKQVTPGPESSYVTPNNELSMVMSKRMRADSFYSVDIAEQPASSETLWHRPSTVFNADNTTKATFEHGPFINDSQHYYYPVVDSRVEDVHFNCFYPGKGPVVNPIQVDGAASLICDDKVNKGNCCPVTVDPNNAFCCEGLKNITSREQCLANLPAH